MTEDARGREAGEVLASLRGIVAAVVGGGCSPESVEPDVDLFAPDVELVPGTSLDSMTLVEIVGAIEDELDILLNDLDEYESLTLRQISADAASRSTEDQP